ncbi:ASCH domain-containing protein [Yinghuangia sp. ASG 101]|uniref:ASCH domain-containing protein n=1 Tax=Yinghuangia sp. ASG 101 TaxID=2896848 RepID=UPI001E30CA6F|nr:ASCH domain-containing protein [Yinghuangia sp. ASG 101]UGQ12368.1 ASCH domain-containing protein [Yinghuangia sp. ASG 101]
MTAEARTINIRRPFLELIVAGVKTIEVRVGYPSMRKIQAGQPLTFVSGDLSYSTTVDHVAEYPSFDALLDAEDAAAIGGEDMSRDELLRACRDIYPPAKEALGVLAIHLRGTQ